MWYQSPLCSLVVEAESTGSNDPSKAKIDIVSCDIFKYIAEDIGMNDPIVKVDAKFVQGILAECRY